VNPVLLVKRAMQERDDTSLVADRHDWATTAAEAKAAWSATVM
jgi:hypothetical protein